MKINKLNIKSDKGSLSVGRSNDSSGSDFKGHINKALSGNHIIDSIIKEKADKYKVDPALIFAVCETESNFKNNEVSRCGATGIMQLMPGTSKAFKVNNPYDPRDNIEGGVHLLSKLIKHFNGNERAALMGYNAGSGRVNKATGTCNIGAANRYADIVLKRKINYSNKIDNADFGIQDNDKLASSKIDNNDSIEVKDNNSVQTYINKPIINTLNDESIPKQEISNNVANTNIDYDSMNSLENLKLGYKNSVAYQFEINQKILGSVLNGEILAPIPVINPNLSISAFESDGYQQQNNNSII